MYSDSTHVSSISTSGTPTPISSLLLRRVHQIAAKPSAMMPSTKRTTELLSTIHQTMPGLRGSPSVPGWMARPERA